ncbi:MAG: dienelactone hydrolase family protein [Ferruginibacter sp.]|nr:dienelactone hydrolase family protein [Ferruginibacter sp.]
MILKKTVIVAGLLTCLNSVSAQTDYYRFYKSKSEKATQGWILLLPGSSGFTIFDDSTFYDRKAAALNKSGYDVLLLDYKSFYRNSVSADKPKGTTGEKISWVVKQLLAQAKQRQQIDTTKKGHIIGWSLAGEGVFRLLKDTAFITGNNINSAALFYPSNNEEIEITTAIPVLLQMGGSDKTAVPDKIKKQVKSFEKIKLVIYPGSFHGFDVETITQPKLIKFPPVIGKKHTFLYNKEAAEKAYSELVLFLNKT